MKKLLAILLSVLLLCGILPLSALFVAAEASVTIDFTDVSNRVSFTTEQQVWEQNGITVTNIKNDSSSNVADYANPARFYMGSIVTISYPGITSLVIQSIIGEGKDYFTAWTNSFSADATATTDTEAQTITITMSEPVDSFTWEKLTKQARAYSITVYTNNASEEPACEHEYGSEYDTTCNLCGEVRELSNYPTIEAGVDTIVTITEDGEMVDFLFTPDESGFYAFTSHNYVDTYGYLLDVEGNQLTDDDDGGSDGQFKIVYYLEMGTTYVLRSRFYAHDRTGSFPVRIEQASIESYALEPVEIIENTNGYEDSFGYCYAVDSLKLEINYTDGTVDRYHINDYISNAYEMQAAQLWTAGNTYTVTVSLMGITMTVDVTIIEDPIENIVVEDIVYIEGGGYWAEGEDTSYMAYSIHPNTITIYFKDGSSQVYEGVWDVSENLGISLNCLSDQSYENPWGVGEHTALVCYGNRQWEYTIRIQEDPIDYIVAEDVILREGNGYWTEGEGPSYYCYNINPHAVTVYFKDGTSKTYENLWQAGEELGVSFSYTSDQSYENPWGVGEHTAIIYYGDRQWEYVVRIEADPILRIEVEDVVYIEGNGEWHSSWNSESSEEVRWMYYSPTPHNFTVYFTDGTIKSYYSRWEVEEDLGIWLDYTSDQSYENQWGVGEHIAILYYGNSEWTYTVRIEESPIARIEVEDLVRYEGAYDCYETYWDEESGQDVEWKYYSVHPNYVTVYFKDGTSVYKSIYELGEIDGIWLQYSHDQTPHNQWGAGEHTAYITHGNYQWPYTVRIEENPIQRIEVEDIVYIEGTGYWTEGGAPSYMAYDEYPNTLTIYFKDGTFQTYNNLWEAETEVDIPLSYGSNQSYENQWGVGNHTAYVSCGDRRWEYTVRIIENPIVNIEVEDVVHTEGTGEWYYSWDEETGEYYEEWMYYYATPYNITVYFNDGTSKLYYDRSEINEDLGIWLDYTSDQSYENPWGVGEHTATLYFGDYKWDYTVRIVENPVQSVVFDPITYYEYTGGSWSGYWDENDNHIAGAYYEYYIDPQHVTVTMRDGSVYSGEFYDVREQLEDILEEVWGMSYSSGQSYETPWGIGEHTVMVEWLNLRSELAITIVESPVVSVEIAPVTFYEGTNGDFYNGWYEYYIYGEDLAVTATLADGTVLSGWDGIADALGAGADYACITEQSKEDPWEVGTHTVTVKTLGFEMEVPVTILPTPVAAFVVKDVVLYQGLDSYEYDEDVDRYYENCRLVGVLLKDGSMGTIDEYGYLYYNGDYYYAESNCQELQDEEPWMVGNTYAVTATLMGVTATFNVTIEAKPIEEIVMIKTPDQITYRVGESVDLKGAVFSVVYTDGTYEDWEITDHLTAGYNIRFFSEKLDRFTSVYLYGRFDTAGRHDAVLEMFDMTCTFPVTVKENLIESITVRENADKTITITAHNSDGTTTDMEVLDMIHLNPMDDEIYETTLVTDHGEYFARILADDDSFAIGLYIDRTSWGDDDAACLWSNTIGTSDWFAVIKMMLWESNWYFFPDAYSIAYNREVTAENIDAVVALAMYVSSVEWSDYNYLNNYFIFDADVVRMALMEVFGLSDVDLSLSLHYNAEKDNFMMYAWIRGADQPWFSEPSDIRYDNGVWYVTVTSHGETVNVQFNEDLQIVAVGIHADIPAAPDTPVEPEIAYGDLNGDGNINNRDLAAMQQYLNGWNVTVDEDACDVNGDGNINNRDLALLQQYLNGWDVTLGK